MTHEKAVIVAGLICDAEAQLGGLRGQLKEQCPHSIVEHAEGSGLPLPVRTCYVCGTVETGTSASNARRWQVNHPNLLLVETKLGNQVGRTIEVAS